MAIGNNFYGLHPSFWRERPGQEWSDGFVAMARVRINSDVVDSVAVPIMPTVEYQYAPVKWAHHAQGKILLSMSHN